MRRKVSLPLFALVSLLLALGGTAARADDPDVRIVPNLIGRTPSEAGRMVRAQGLGGIDADVLAVDDSVAVLWQHPTAGAYVPAGTPVQVRWREAPAATRRVERLVPDLEGMTREQAVEALERVGLLLEIRTARTGRVPHRIGGQTPHPGVGVWPGSVVRASIYVPEGTAELAPTLTTVPDLRGRRRAEVVDLLARARLGGPADMTTPGGDAEEHVADLQTPHPRERVAVGTIVRVQWRLLGTLARMVRVPDFKGLSAAEARGRALEHELVAEVRFELVPGRTGGGVFAQSPEAGAAIVRGSTVQVTVNGVGVQSSGAIVDVPNLRNMLPAEAEAALKAAGMSMTIHPRRDSIRHLSRALLPAPPRPGRVWSWDPKRAGMGSAITVWLASEDAEPPRADGTLLMPDLRMLPRAQAERVVTDAGLVVARVVDDWYMSRYAPRGTPVGTIWKQEPERGARVRPGASVSLYVYGVSRGNIDVPNVVGMSLAKARTWMVPGDLRVGVAGAPPGARDTDLVVTAVSPAPGTHVVNGSSVTLTVAAAGARVPSVMGLTKEEAVARLREASLSADLVGPTGAARGARTRVTGQHPAPGTTLARNAMVRVTWAVVPFEFRPMPRR